MQLEFIPVEEFYFALTLSVRTLEDIEQPELTPVVASRLAERFGQPSTVAAASQNTFNYVFRVDQDNAPAPQLILSIADWHDSLRLSSNYGWVLNADRKPVRTEKYPLRSQFAHEVKQYLKEWLDLPSLQVD
jgi:hypothetical protein